MSTENQDDKIFSYGACCETASFIKDKIKTTPDILIICGSGLGTLAETIRDPVEIKYEDIPNFPASTVAGHEGKLVFGTLSNVNVVCMKGRFHYFEGYSLKAITMPIRVMHLVGVKLMIVTNAAGGINENYKPGDIMLIKDHLNLFYFAGLHPLRGPNDERFGLRFYPINNAYNKGLIKKAKRILTTQGLGDNTHEGVYAQVGGPTYETVAEIRALKTLGADAVGMSTIPEVCVAVHCGMIVFGLSLISDVCSTSYEDEINTSHEDVLATVSKMAEKLKAFVTEFVGDIPCGKKNNAQKDQ